jgi:hypothetical protein
MKNCGYCGRENEDSAVVCCECGLSEFPETADERAPLARVHAPELEPEMPEPDVASGEEAAICPFCLFPNLPERQWCKNCGSPVNAPVLDPFQAAIASGLMWRGVVRGRPKPIVLCMTWLLFFPMFLGDCFGIFLAAKSDQNSFAPLCQIVLSTIYSLIPIVILFQATRNFVTIPKPTLEN